MRQDHNRPVKTGKSRPPRTGGDKPWVIRFHPAFLDARLTPMSHRARYLLQVLDGNARMRPFCWHGNDELAGQTGMSLRSLQETLDELEKDGWIARAYTGGKKPVRVGIIMRRRIGPKTPAADTPEKLALAEIDLRSACGNPHAKSGGRVRKSAPTACEKPHAPACGNPHRNKDVAVKKDEVKKDEGRIGDSLSLLNDNGRREGAPLRDGDINRPPHVAEFRARQAAERELEHRRRAELRLQADPESIPIQAEELKDVLELAAPHVEPAPAVPQQVAPAVERAMVDVRQAASMADEPINRDAPSPLGRHGYRTTGDPERDSRLSRYLDHGGVMAEQARKHLAGHENEYAAESETASKRIPAEERDLAVAKILGDRAVGNPTTLELLAGLGPGCDPGSVQRAVDLMCSEMNDGKSQGWYACLFNAVRDGDIPPQVPIYAYAYAHAPGCPEPGRWFNAAVKRMGFNPRRPHRIGRKGRSRNR